MTIECIGFKQCQINTLQGFANFYIPATGMEIYGCTLHDKDGRKWLNLPSREYTQDGEKKYLSVIRFREKSHYDAFTSAAKAAVEKWIAHNDGAEPTIQTQDNAIKSEQETDDLPF